MLIGVVDPAAAPQVRDGALRQTLAFGVGIHHAGLCQVFAPLFTAATRAVFVSVRGICDQKSIVCLAVGLGVKLHLTRARSGTAILWRSSSSGCIFRRGGGSAACSRVTMLTLPRAQVLVATSTLAWGVNYPAHLVVVKVCGCAPRGTQTRNKH